jgi:hypothetical protein
MSRPTPYYNAAGKRVPGVTTCNETLGFKTRALVAWANRIGREEDRHHSDEKEEQGLLGTFAHLGMEADVKGEPFDINALDVPPQHKIMLYTAMGAFETWKVHTTMKLIESEIALVSEKMQCGGRIDIVAELSGVPCIVDLKTGNGVYVDALVQIAAYGAIWNENFPDRQIQGYHILRVDKHHAGFAHRYWPPEAIIGTPENPAVPLETFCHARRLYELSKPLRKLVG